MRVCILSILHLHPSHPYCCAPYLYLSLYEIFSVSVLVFLINIQSVNSCNFGVLNKGGEFRVFLLNRLGHPPKISLQPHGLQHPRLPCPSISQSLLKLMSIESVMWSNHLVLCHPLLLLPSVFPSIMVFSSDLALRIRWPKYWSFSFSISPSNGYSGLISFRIDWFDLDVQGTLKSLLQNHNSKASILGHSAFFMV